MGWWQRILPLNRSGQVTPHVPRLAQASPLEQRVQEQINPTYFSSAPTQEDWYWTCLSTRNALLYKITDDKREGLLYTKILNCAIMRAKVNNVLPSRCCIDATNINTKKHPRADDRYRRSIVVDTLNPHGQNDKPLLKKCSRCPNSYPATTEYFHRDRGNKDGLRNMCKKCAIAYSKSYNKQHPQERSEYGKKYNAEHKQEKHSYNAQYFSVPGNLEKKR